MEQTRAIIIHESPNEAEQLVNSLRNSGQHVRSVYCDSEESFSDAMSGNSVDIVLARPNIPSVDIKFVIDTIEQSGEDVPVVVLADSRDSVAVVEHLKAGAVDVVPVEELEHLQFAMNRELSNLQERRFKSLLELEVEEVQKRCQLLLGSSREPIAYIMDGMHIYANESYIEIFGFDDEEEMEGVPIMDVIASDDQSKFKDFFKSYQKGENKTASFTCHGQGNKEEPFDVHFMFSSAEYDGEICTQVIISLNVMIHQPAPVQEAAAEPVHTEAEINEKIAQAKSQDPLTGIYHREYFKTYLKDKIVAADEEGAASSMFYVSVDKFTKLKDQYGLEIWDQLIVQIADFLKDKVPEGSGFSRYGEADFCFWWDSGEEGKAQKFGEQLRLDVENYLLEAGDESASVTLSVGITFLRAGVGSAYDIIARGMKACVSLQQEGDGNDVRIYRPPANVEQNDGEEGGASDSLQKAIDNNLFRILFQPIISLRGEEFEFYEVLLRLIDDDGKEISPDQFLDDADTANLCAKIDRWVILQSIKSLASRRAQGNDTHIMINLTMQSVKDASLIPWLGVALKAARLPKGVVTFQVNENDAIRHVKQVKEFVEKLEELNCKFSISRFGGGDGSVGLLKHLNAGYLKLDGTIIRSLSKGDNQEHLSEIIAKAHDKDKLIVAPFVESAGVLSTLWQLGVNYIQGYYLQPPMRDMTYDFSQGQ